MTTYAPQSYGNPEQGIPQVPYAFDPPLEVIQVKPSGYQRLMLFVTPVNVAGCFAAWALLAGHMGEYRGYGYGHSIASAIIMAAFARAYLNGYRRILVVILTVLFFLIFPPLSLSIVPLVLFLLVFLKTRKPRERGFQPASPMDSLRTVWGVAGGHVGANKAFGEAGQIGADGESIMGTALDSFAARWPHVRVFHGLEFTPGVLGADVDHCLLIGNLVVMIDSKKWKIANYTWLPFGAIRDGVPFDGGDVKIASAMNKWQSYLADTNAILTSRIVMVSPETESRHYTIDDRVGNPNYKLVTLNEFLREMDMIAASSQPVVERRLVTAMKEIMQ